ncbi:MAG: TDT family transporter, partial [[Eubacterium] sulci]|nr:TDT family transporter [[Eubacterium] sulci]
QLFWFAGIALHILCIALFTSRYIAKFNWENVHASWFIVYVGIVVASVTAPAFNFETSVGTVAFWFGFICLVVLFIVVSIRYIKYGPAPDSAESLACIYAAPTSLCIAGYIQSITPKSVPFLLVMLVIASIIYVVSFVWCIRCLTKPFFPSHAAFTFPFVISAIAYRQTSACLADLGQPLQWLDGIATVETVLAAGLCVVVLVRLLAYVRDQTLEICRK